MSFRPTIASAVSTTSPLTITGTGPGSGGALASLGARAWLDGAAVDQTIMWVTSTGEIAGGPSYGPHAAATDVEVVLPANTGPMELVYVRNATVGVIPRGTPLAWSDTATGVGGVIASTAGLPVVGVALSNIPADHCFYAARSGVVPVLYAGAATQGVLLQAAAGALDDAGASTSNFVGICLVDPGGAGLALAKLILP